MSTSLDSAKAWLGDNYLLSEPIKRLTPKTFALEQIERKQRIISQPKPHRGRNETDQPTQDLP
jgi:hypothetical protein